MADTVHPSPTASPPAPGGSPPASGGGAGSPSPLEALPPSAMALRAVEAGAAKARGDLASLFALAVLAGAFIALGAALATTALAGSGDLPWGVARLLAGVAFSLGLVLVVNAGAELFTGDNLVVIAWAARRVRTGRLLRLWAIAYAGNLVGALATAGLVFAAGEHELGRGAVGDAALTVAAAKSGLGWGQAVALGVLCNALVCLAVWLTYSARTLTDRVLAVVPPVTAFVALGFEHSIANMYFLPYALLVHGDGGWLAGRTGLPDLSQLTWERALWANLAPVTLGNLIGGVVLVGAVYWFIYLRPRPTT